MTFDIATDVKVYALVMDQSVFQLGFSTLDGPDVLGASTGDYMSQVQLEADVISVDTVVGTSFEQGLLSKMETGTATVSMQTTTFDPYANNLLRVGTEMEIYNTDYGTLFKGWLESADLTYNADGSMNLSLSLADASKRWMSQVIPDFDLPTLVGHAEPYTMPEIFDALTTATNSAFTWVDYTGSLFIARIPDLSGLDVIVGDIVTQVQDAEQSFMFVGELGILNAGPRGALIPAPGYEPYVNIGNVHSVLTPPYEHVHLVGIDVALSTEDIPNKVIATLPDGVTTVTSTNQDMIDLFGENTYDVTVNVFDETDLTKWADALAERNNIKRVSSVKGHGVNELGETTPLVGYKPGSFIRVMFERGTTSIDEIFAASRVSHSITVDNWFTTLELWKGN